MTKVQYESFCVGSETPEGKYTKNIKRYEDKYQKNKGGTRIIRETVQIIQKIPQLEMKMLAKTEDIFSQRTGVMKICINCYFVYIYIYIEYLFIYYILSEFLVFIS